MRPTQSIDVTTSYFLPATLGGDHAFKVGYRWRTARGESISHTGGNAVARYANVAGTNPNCALRFDDAGAAVYDCNADLFRDGYTNYNLGTQRHLRAGHLLGEALHAQPRRAVGSRDRRSAAGPGSGQPAHPADHAGDRLPRPRRRRRVERHLAAPRHDLRHHGHRQVGRARVLLDVLRPDGARASSPAS